VHLSRIVNVLVSRIRVILVHLVLYNLMDAHPDQQYFRWKEEICKFIFEYWSYLLPDKERKWTAQVE